MMTTPDILAIAVGDARPRILGRSLLV